MKKRRKSRKKELTEKELNKLIAKTNRLLLSLFEKKKKLEFRKHYVKDL